MTSPLWESFREGCGTCVFWSLSQTTSHRQCRRHPPVVMCVRAPNQDCDVVEQHQPWTAEDDWCGEYKREMPRDQSAS